MDDVRERLDAVERALTDGEGDLTALAEGAATAERVEQLETDVADLREDVQEVQAATQALRGYVGNVRSVNETVEQRAETALARVERLEAERTPAAARSGANPGQSGPPESNCADALRRCSACGRTHVDGEHTGDTRLDGELRPTANDGASHGGTAADARTKGSRSDGPTLDGFDPEVDPDVPDLGQGSTGEPGRNGATPRGADGDPDDGVVSRIRDLV